LKHHKDGIKRIISTIRKENQLPEKQEEKVVEEVLETTEAEAEEEKTRFDQELSRFKNLLEEDREAAYRRYGFALMRSVDPEVAAKEALELRGKSTDPCDLYNKGVLDAMEGKVAKAIKSFEAALDTLESMPDERVKDCIMDRPTLLADLGINLCLCLTERDQKSEGKKALKRTKKLASKFFDEQELPALWEAFEEEEQEEEE